MRAVEPTEGDKIVLLRELTDLERARENDLHRLVKFFIDARIKGCIGDILLPDDCRLEGLIDRHIEQYYNPKNEEEVREYRRNAT